MAKAVRVSVSGLKELEAGLAELSKATARNTMQRALTKAAEPMRQAAERNAPERTGALKRSIIVTSRTNNRIGKKEYGATLAAGGTRAQAVSALRDARRAKGYGESFAEVYMGPAKGSARDAIKALVQEFGSRKQAAQPYMRPAFDAEAQGAIDRVAGELSTEIDKSVQRARRRAARKAAKG